MLKGVAGIVVPIPAEKENIEFSRIQNKIPLVHLCLHSLSIV